MTKRRSSGGDTASTLARPQNSLRALVVAREDARMLTDEQLPRVPRGRLRRARRARWTPTTVARMRERIWRRLEHHGAVRDDPSTWRPHQANGLRTDPQGRPRPRTTRRCSRARSTISSAPGVWRTPGQLGPGARDVPDAGPVGRAAPALAPRPPLRPAAEVIWGVNVFLFVDDVEPRGGGTLVVRGSPRHVRAVRRAGPARPPHAEAVADGVRRQPSRGSARSAIPHDTADRVRAVPRGDRRRRHPHPGRGAHGPARRRRGVPPVADPQHRAERRATAPA